MHPSAALARVLVDELIRQGVREAVLAPGSRSAPLAFALRDAAVAGRLRLHVRVDERSAGFLALGLAKAPLVAAPTVVVTTSGTAAANLHPAVLEAHHAGVPLVVLTADRPPELRGVGANQTADQVGLFGAVVRTMTDLAVPREAVGQAGYWRDVVFRAVVSARGTRSNDPGPVHLNVGLPEPLVPEASDSWIEALDDADTTRRAEAGSPPPATELVAGPRTVVIAGDGAGWQARSLADAAGWPLLAEPSSGARSGPNAIGPYRLLLESPGLGADIERVIAYGRPTLSRPVTRLMTRNGIELVVVSDRARWPDPARRAGTVLAAAAPPAGALLRRDGTADAWLDRWRVAGARADAAVERVLFERVLSGPGVARATAARVRPGGLLFAGASNPIRDLDVAMQPYPHAVGGAPETVDVRVLANRGLSGIDGTVSSAVGAALAWQADLSKHSEAASLASQQRPTAPAYALLGDLTVLHDSNGLVMGPDEPRPDLVIVVLNDDGGGIFHTLEPGEAAHAASFERLFGTPHGVEFAALCAATDTEHELVETTASLLAALERADRRGAFGIRVIEARVDRSDRRELEARLAEAVAAAVKHG